MYIIAVHSRARFEKTVKIFLVRIIRFMGCAHWFISQNWIGQMKLLISIISCDNFSFSFSGNVSPVSS